MKYELGQKLDRRDKKQYGHITLKEPSSSLGRAAATRRFKRQDHMSPSRPYSSTDIVSNDYYTNPWYYPGDIHQVTHSRNDTFSC